MTMTHRFLLFSLSSLLCVFNGCGGPAKPADFPDLVRPVTIKIHKDGTPLSGVSIILHPQDSTLPFLIAGQTGENGIATLKTSRNTYIKPGAPVGKFLVQLTEPIEIDMSDFKVPTRTRIVDGIEFESVSEAAREAWSIEYHKRTDAVRKFSKVLGSTESPLWVDVASATAIVEFDVSKY